MSELHDFSLFDDGFAAALSQAQSADKTALIQSVWPSDFASFDTDEAAICTAFIRHLGKESSTIKDHQHSFALCTLRRIADTIQMLQNKSTRALTDVVREERNQALNMDEAVIQRTIELCVRLWLTINVNTSTVAVGGRSSRERTLDWTSQTSLDDFASKTFVKRTHQPAHQGGANIDARFTAEYLVNHCGIEIVWTNYLTDHLKFDSDGDVLLVFRHKAYLYLQLEGKAPGPIPPAVFEEALDSLNLLFPYGEKLTEQLLIRLEDRDFYNIGACGRERILDLQHYGYWTKELGALLQRFESPPQTLKQLAFNRRNKQEWYAFWVAVMVAFLTLVSVPCAILQAVYTIKTYQLAVAQNNSPARNEL